MFKSLLLLLFNQFILNQLTCGVRNIFSGERLLNQKALLFKNDNLPEQEQIQQITVYGWFQITGNEPLLMPILQLQLQPIQNDQNQQQTIQNFFQLAYDTSEPTSNKLIVQILNFENTLQTQIIQTSIPKNNWIFIAISIDFSQNKAKLFMKSYNDQNFIIDQFINYQHENFFITQTYQINIGFFYDFDSSSQQLLDSSLIGQAKDFSYTFEYFDELENLIYMIPQSSTNTNFIFDLESQNNKVSKDNQQIPFTFQSDKIDENGQIVLKGDNPLEIMPKSFFRSNIFVESPGIYISMLYKENLGDVFNLLQILDDNNESLIDIQLKGNLNNRTVSVQFTDTSIQLISSQSLIPDQYNDIYIAFLRNSTQLQIMIIVNNILELSQQFTFPIVNSKGFIFGQNNQMIEGYVKLQRLNIFNNSSAIIYKQFAVNSQCYQNCFITSEVAFQNYQCYKCSSMLTLNIQTGRCIQYCPFDQKSINQICQQCQQPQCQELDQKDFQIQKINENQYKITQLNQDIPIVDFKNQFQILVNNQGIQSQYNVDQQPQQNFAIYDINLPNNQGNQTQTIQWVPSELNPIVKQNNNVYQRILTLNKQDSINTTSPQNIPIIIPNNPSINPNSNPKDIFISDNENKIQKTERKRDGYYRYEALGKAAFGIFIASLFFGILGFFFRCPYSPEDWNNFHYQKFIQTFLMTQYFACWLFYNIRLHDNLYGFLDKLFYYMIGWHKVFHNTTRSDYDNSDYFNTNYDRVVHKRFYEENVYTTFLTNFSIIMIIQGSFLLIYIILKILQIFNKKKVSQQQSINQNNQQLMTLSECKKPIYYFEFNILVTLFLIFIVETTLFIMYNFWHKKFHHRYFIFSLLFSILYLLINLALIGFVLSQGLKEKQSNVKSDELHLDERSNYYITYRRTQFIWRGLARAQIYRLFHGLQYLYYGIFSFILVICYRNTDVQMALSLVNTLWFVGYVIAIRPPYNSFWRIEQAIVHFFIFLINLLFWIVVFDKRYNNISTKHKDRLQTTIAIIMFLIIVWNFFMLVYGLIKRIQECKKSKLTRQYIQNNTHYNRVSETDVDQKELIKNENIKNTIQNNDEYVSVHKQEIINQENNKNNTMQDFINRFREDSGDQEYTLDQTSYISDNFDSQNIQYENYNEDEQIYNLEYPKSLEMNQNKVDRKFTFNPMQTNRQSQNDESISFQKQDQRFKDEVIGFHNRHKTIKGLNQIKEEQIEDSDEEQFTKRPRFTN